VDKYLNPVLKALKMREMKTNPDTKSLYAAAMDGNQVENWIDDLWKGLVDVEPDLTAPTDSATPWGLERSPSTFLHSQAWQKKLNEILRLSNSFANAGAIPKKVKRAGEKATAEYKEQRKENMPSPARWIFEQALLQQHAYHRDVHQARDRRAYYAPVDLTADDLAENEERYQKREGRRLRWEAQQP